MKRGEVRPLYRGPWSLRRNQHQSWSVWWRSPHRAPGGGVAWKGHGKVIAPRTATEEQARQKAEKFIVSLRIPLVEPVDVEQTRAEVEAILARQRKEGSGRRAVGLQVAKPAPPAITKSLEFAPPALYLLNSGLCSQRVLGEYLVRRLADADMLRKTISQLQEKLACCEGETLLASWLLKHRDELLAAVRGQKSTTLKTSATAARAIMDELTQRLLVAGPEK